MRLFRGMLLGLRPPLLPNLRPVLMQPLTPCPQLLSEKP